MQNIIDKHYKLYLNIFTFDNSILISPHKDYLFIKLNNGNGNRHSDFSEITMGYKDNDILYISANGFDGINCEIKYNNYISDSPISDNIKEIIYSYDNISISIYIDINIYNLFKEKKYVELEGIVLSLKENKLNLQFKTFREDILIINIPFSFTN